MRTRKFASEIYWPLKRHWKICEKVEELENCEHCEQKFGTKLCLGKHLKKAHPDQAKVNLTSVKSNIAGVQCTKCDYVSREAKKLDRHWKTCLQTKGQLISKGNFGVLKSTKNQLNLYLETRTKILTKILLVFW